MPCLYAMAQETVGFGIDRVKPKLAGQTQREHNLEADPRAALLVEHWNRDEWSRLWWVRAELRWEPAPTQCSQRRSAHAIGSAPSSVWICT